jgi:acyl-CoA thioesterase-1
VSGDTTADGLARLGFSIGPGTRLCIVALGGNDLLEGLDPHVTRRNLQAIVMRLKARHIPVMLAGVTAPGVIGPSYARDFDAAFAQVARAARVPFYPDLLAGVYGHPALIQPDGFHPNAAGAAVIAARLAPLVVRALRMEGVR